MWEVTCGWEKHGRITALSTLAAVCLPGIPPSSSSGGDAATGSAREWVVWDVKKVSRLTELRGEWAPSGSFGGETDLSTGVFVLRGRMLPLQTKNSFFLPFLKIQFLVAIATNNAIIIWSLDSRAFCLLRWNKCSHWLYLWVFRYKASIRVFSPSLSSDIWLFTVQWHQTKLFTRSHKLSSNLSAPLGFMKPNAKVFHRW